MNGTKRQKEIQEYKVALEAQAASRWIERKPFRDNPQEYLAKNVAEKSKLDIRYENYNMREAVRPIAEVIKAEIILRSPERKIGDTLDLNRRPPSPEAFKFGRPVGRIFQIPDAGIEIDAFGTGFLVAPNILITNHHVLPSKTHAEGCAVNFGYEFNEFNKLQTGTKYRLSPGTFFFCDEKLDFAVVYVESIDDTGASQLSSLGCIPLIATKGKIVLNDPIHIVQYPLGNYKQYSTVNNFVKDILEDEGFIQYTTDTLASSSGSPAANKYWEVAALHHSGIAMTVGGKVWSRFDKPWEPSSMTDEDKIYVANEGVSVSRIIDLLGKKEFTNPRDAELVRSIIANSQDKMLESGAAGIIPGARQVIEENKQVNSSVMSHNTFNFYNTANIVIQANGKDTSLIGPKKIESESVTALEKKLRFDESYGNRRYKGYKARFLDKEIPFPKIAQTRLDEIILNDGTNEPLLLNYYHYSIVMNKEFRLQMCSAVNVDYDPALKTARDRKEFGDEGNSWRPDPRIPVEYQITNEEFYKPATQVDRGHMVRRDDSCYGNTELEIEYANSDTFHWTNCTPQHEGFNQSKQYGLWGMLENAVKDGLSGDDTKASVFAGPVLVKDEDRKYNGLYYPVKFWKVITAIDEDDGLVAYGFILDQTRVVDKRGLEAKFDFTQFRTQRASLKKIEEEAGIVFPDVLKDADVLVRSGHAADEAIDLESEDQVVIKIKKPS